VYAAEAEARQQRIDSACEPKDWVEWVADFLLSPSCSALDPRELISSSELEARVRAAVRQIEAETGFTLDTDTRQNLREDIRRIWGHLASAAD
jgi:hypothetical protein